VEIEDNKGEGNSYNMSSFKTLLKMSKKVSKDGFDIIKPRIKDIAEIYTKNAWNSMHFDLGSQAY